MNYRKFIKAIGGPQNIRRKRKTANSATRKQESNQWADHDPLTPSADAKEAAEASLLAAMRSTPDSHPEADLCRKYRPLDLWACKDT